MQTADPPDDGALNPDRPLAIAVLAKQVPAAESLHLDEQGFLQRSGLDLEMNPYCRRAVAKGVELARVSGGSCTAFSLGPASAEDVLREAVAWGADKGFHLCDPAFRGSDTLATSRALAAALQELGPFDLILVGRNSVDGDTGQIGPELAEFLDLPFAEGARRLSLDRRHLRLSLEHDDGTLEVELELPAIVSVAERLCDPCKVAPEQRASVPAKRIRRLSASDLGRGPWGAAGSATVVGATTMTTHRRSPTILDGDPAELARSAVAWLEDRSAFQSTPVLGPLSGPEDSSRLPDARLPGGSPPILVLAEAGRSSVTTELLGAARKLQCSLSAKIVALVTSDDDLHVDADELIVLRGAEAPEDVASALIHWSAKEAPVAVLAPSTAFGREVSARTAAALGVGLVGDAIDISVKGGAIISAKPAFSGALVADISCTSATHMVTVRPGVLPPAFRPLASPRRRISMNVTPRRRIRVLTAKQVDDVEILARAATVIGLGTGVKPEEYHQLNELRSALGAELAATRKVTDQGWMPRSRQVGVTGRSIAPRLYVAIGLSGKFNHMVGVRGAETVVAINCDRDAPVFTQVDLGLVGDWHQLVPELFAALGHRTHPDQTVGNLLPSRVPR